MHLYSTVTPNLTHTNTNTQLWSWILFYFLGRIPSLSSTYTATLLISPTETFSLLVQGESSGNQMTFPSLIFYSNLLNCEELIIGINNQIWDGWIPYLMYPNEIKNKNNHLILEGSRFKWSVGKTLCVCGIIHHAAFKCSSSIPVSGHGEAVQCSWHVDVVLSLWNKWPWLMKIICAKHRAFEKKTTLCGALISHWCWGL